MYYIIANWKMNPIELREASSLFEGIKRKASLCKKTKVIVCPTFVHLQALSSSYRGKKISFGGQDIFWEKEGSFTGEVSAYQLKNAGADYCLIGHSERRAMGETDEEVREKLRSALKAEITPIICIGEEERDDDGKYLLYIKKQIKEACKDLNSGDLKDVMLAYEPLWAIGKTADKAMNSHEMHQIALYIRKVLTEMFDEKAANATRILYGGSVESINAGELARNAHVQGFLVGNASLSAKHFGLILDEVEKNI